VGAAAAHRGLAPEQEPATVGRPGRAKRPATVAGNASVA